MHIAITGSSGKIGLEAARSFTEAGHSVVGLDLKPSPDGRRTLPVDCRNFGEVMGALSGVDIASGVPDAVVHLAGIPAPGLAPDHVTLEGNLLSTYHVFSACARLGIPRVVWASSETIFGVPYGAAPASFPIDESSPDRPEFHYALSKQLGEAAADAMVRWSPGLSIYSLRFSNVYASADRAALAAVHDDPRARRGNLWAYVDAADAGRACRLAVAAAALGHQRIVIGAADTLMDIPSARLHADYFPEVPLRQELPVNTPFLTSARAADVIGYVPEVSWRDW